MRRVTRLPLDPPVQSDLDNRQRAVDQNRNDAAFSAYNEWKKARQAPTLRAVLGTLRQMMGERQRCMYCLDSHATDIEHFWPKTPYPQRMFVWLNLVLCCAECGRFKGDRFPLADGAPLLVDPTADDPWDYLDFDPTTGNVVARFDTIANEWTAKGQATAGLLQLDRREAMATGYRRTYRRLVDIAARAMEQAAPNSEALCTALLEADDHGLLAWCFHRSGQNESPFRELRERHPGVWASCAAACT